MMKRKRKRKGVRSWLENRFDLENIEGPIKKQITKPLPKHISWFHTLGSMALFLFLSQVITGVLLLVYYRPTVDEAFESVQFIMTQAQFGWLYRQIHAWGAHLMVIVVFLHMLRTFISGSFKRPREITWVTGVFLFLMTLIFAFTGYLLPWNQLAYWATTVGTEIAGAIPYIGEFLKTFIRGGNAVGAETLSRFFVIHVIILPWILFFIVGLHLFLVRYQGISTMDKVGSEEKPTKRTGIPFFPDHMLKEGVVWFFLLGIIITLAILAPFELGEKADPLNTPHSIKPEWYFLPMYQVLKYFPKLTGIIVVSLAPLLLLLWPFLDRTKEKNIFKRPISMAVGIFTILSFLILGILGYLSESKKTIFGKTYEFDIYGKPHPVENDKGGETKNIVHEK